MEMKTIYVPVKEDLTNGLESRLRVMTPSTNLLDFVEKTEAIILSKEDAEKIKAIDFNKALEMAEKVYPDNMGGMDNKGVNRYRSGYAKGFIDALQLLNK